MSKFSRRGLAAHPARPTATATTRCAAARTPAKALSHTHTALLNPGRKKHPSRAYSSTTTVTTTTTTSSRSVSISSNNNNVTLGTHGAVRWRCYWHTMRQSTVHSIRLEALLALLALLQATAHEFLLSMCLALAAALLLAPT